MPTETAMNPPSGSPPPSSATLAKVVSEAVTLGAGGRMADALALLKSVAGVDEPTWLRISIGLAHVTIAGWLPPPDGGRYVADVEVPPDISEDDRDEAVTLSAFLVAVGNRDVDGATRLFLAHGTNAGALVGDLLVFAAATTRAKFHGGDG